MRVSTLIVWTAAVPIAVCFTVLAPTGVDAQSFAVREARVFDGESLHPKMTVVVRDGIIESVGPDTVVPPGLEVFEGQGRTLLPGLMDSHIHVRGDALTQTLAFGVTTVMDMFTDPVWAAERRAEQEQGQAVGRSDLLSAGLVITAPGAHGTENETEVPTITSPSEAREAVESRVAQGSDYIKIIYEPPLPSIDSATMQAVVEESHRQGRMAVVHVINLAHARTAIATGADGLVHLFSAPDARFLELAVDRRAFVVPTLSFTAPVDGDRGAAALAAHPQVEPYLSGEQIKNLLWARPPNNRNPVFQVDSAAASIRMLADRGVPILAGTDAPNPGTAWGASQHRELELLVEAGLSPADALRAATSVPARVFGLNDRGRIAPGLRADLILVQGDPTRDILATRDLVAVWKEGVRFDRESYRARLGR